MPRLSSNAIRKWIVSGSLFFPIVGIIALGSCNRTPQEWTKKLQYVAANPESDVSAFVRSIRPVYPYSVIPGGVYSRRELQNSIAHDRVIASHYAAFDIAHAVLLRTTAPVLRYVSYRKRDRVVWTRTPLRIPQGELLLSDGSSFARARCGNRLSSTPVRPAPNGGPDVELSIPDIEAPRSNTAVAPLDESRVNNPVIPLSRPTPQDVLSGLELEPGSKYVNQDVATPILPAPALLVPGSVGSPIRPLLPVPTPSEPPIAAPVPEPSTRLQVMLTLGIALGLFFFRRARRQPE